MLGSPISQSGADAVYAAPGTECSHGATESLNESAVDPWWSLTRQTCRTELVDAGDRGAGTGGPQLGNPKSEVGCPCWCRARFVRFLVPARLEPFVPRRRTTAVQL
jgi:hypothetical protein